MAGQATGLPEGAALKNTEQQENFDPRENYLLASRASEDYDALIQKSAVVPLKFRKRLFRQDEPIPAVYFPLTCMVSLVVTPDGKAQMEMATIGREGVAGASELLQAQGAMGLSLIQIPGEALKITADAFR